MFNSILECLGMPREQLDVGGEKDVWTAMFHLLPLQPRPRLVKWMDWGRFHSSSDSLKSYFVKKCENISSWFQSKSTSSEYFIKIRFPFPFFSLLVKKVGLKYRQKWLDKVVICSVTLIQTIYHWIYRYKCINCLCVILCTGNSISVNGWWEQSVCFYLLILSS